MIQRLIFIASLLAMTGCDFDFGNGASKARESSVLETDAGVTTTEDGSVVGGSGCFFQPCTSAYGTSCGWICPERQ